jgi:hypothetical protein
VIQWIQKGVQINPVNSSTSGVTIIPQNAVWEPEQVAWVDVEIGRLHAEGALLECGRETLKAISPIKLVGKPGPKKFRMVVSMVRANKNFAKVKFKFEGLKTILELVKQGWWMITFDLREGYHQLMVHKETRRWFGIVWKGKFYCFLVLPFGWTLAPWVFTKAMREVVKYLRSQGIYVVAYLDDWIVMARTLQELLEIRDTKVAPLFERLGLIRHPEKGHWEPTQRAQVLGLIIDSLEGKVYVPEEKLAKIEMLLDGILSGVEVTVNNLAKIAGLLIAVMKAFPMVKLYTREFYNILKEAVFQQGWVGTCILTEQAREDAVWLRANLRMVQGSSFTVSPLATHMYTDASDRAWGAVIGEKRAGEMWDPQWAQRHPIHEKELLAVLKAMQAFLPIIQGKELILLGDNKVTVSYLKNWTGKVPKMVDIVREIWRTCLMGNIRIQGAWWIPTQGNLSDLDSRTIDSGDWECVVFKRIQEWMHGRLTIDRFASSYNAKLPRWNSWRAAPEAEAVNAFCQDWRGEVNYVCAPLNLIARALRFIETQNVEAVVVVPIWPSQPWWPLMKTMVTKELELGLGQECFRATRSGKCEPLKAQWRFVAVHLNGTKH